PGLVVGLEVVVAGARAIAGLPGQRAGRRGGGAAVGRAGGAQRLLGRGPAVLSPTGVVLVDLERGSAHSGVERAARRVVRSGQPEVGEVVAVVAGGEQHADAGGVG